MGENQVSLRENVFVCPRFHCVLSNNVLVNVIGVRTLPEPALAYQGPFEHVVLVKQHEYEVWVTELRILNQGIVEVLRYFKIQITLLAVFHGLHVKYCSVSFLSFIEANTDPIHIVELLSGLQNNLTSFFRPCFRCIVH
jgi:hypothetical protein